MKFILAALIVLSFSAHAAMDKDRCGSAVVTSLKAINPDITGAAETALLPYWKAVCDELIKEITGNMQIETTVEVPGAQAGSSTLSGTGMESTIQ